MRENSKRIQHAKEVYFSSLPEICPYRAVLITEAYKKYESLPIQLKRAKALEEILTKMPIYILDYELLVSNLGYKPRTAPVFPEFTVDYLKKDINELDKRPGEKFVITDEHKKMIFDTLDFWKGRTIKERNYAMLPQEVIDAGEDGVKVIDGAWVYQNGDGHTAADYPKAIKEGLRSIIDFCKNKLATMDVSADPENIYKRLFYESVIISNEAVIQYAHRYADLAEEMAKKETNPERKKDLLKIAEVTRRVPEFPARTFWEATQTILFLQTIIQIETNAHSIGIGRYDVMTYPFYKNDLENGVMTEDEAYDLIQLFRIKLSEYTKLREWAFTDLFRGHPMFQNLTIGGTTPDGKCAANDVTYLFLDSTENLPLIQPALCARISKVSTDKFVDRCSEVITCGGGFPALYGDDMNIESLRHRGVSQEDAEGYTLMGCIEPIPQGKWGGRNGACFFNLTKALELALYNGKDPRTGVQMKEGIGDLSTFKSFNEVMEAFKVQVDYYVKQEVIKDNVEDYVWEEMLPTPLLSSLISDCLGRGKELKKGGAIYDFTGGQTGNIANTANSLAAIKKLVFDDKVITGKELMEAMQSNFEGPRGKEIQSMCINKVPKYGNDIPYVDDIARDAFTMFLRAYEGYKTTRYGRGPIGNEWHQGTGSVSANISMGRVVSATPDGRKAYTPFADVESAYHGTDKCGPTAMLNSASKLPHYLLSGGSLLNLKISPSSFK